jgi:predicted O-linked N-acetylglucosamine transferase (SPINDLY family)
MGVPVITICGNLQASRIGASLLRAMRLGDLIAANSEDYVEKAVRLATNSRRLATLRSTLRQRMRNGRLMNGRKFAKEIERVYRALWRQHCEKTNLSSPAPEPQQPTDLPELPSPPELQF